MSGKPRVHELKTWPEFFESVFTGKKTFEVRYDDRGFRAGDVLHLKEWEPTDMVYTGRDCMVTVGYVLAGPCFGVAQNYVVLGFEYREIADLHTRLAECEREKNKVGARLVALRSAQLLSLTPEALYGFGRAVTAAGWHNNGANIADAANAWRDDRAEVERLNSAIAKMVDAAMHASKNLDAKDAELAETQRLLEVQLAVGDKLTAEIDRLRAEFMKEAHALDDAKAELAALRDSIKPAIECLGRYETHKAVVMLSQALRDALGR